ncbi:cytochrome P450 [Amycolatopsis sp. PS_44_ISF1]|uniref:cytochrome P450 n=1 Tax=Amycolatopsis sp. PS_44_ISF1 TaxID=2974917 RepID=UPI0028DFD535|nr:cytochrome P450 [Amycolatopsis sp. PS_44_ISF1]MDT8912231.1 cytochrome P450 [Amycolatopsis sp. PS_44_ISF1]
MQLGVNRVATTDVPIGEVTVPAGSTFVIAVPEANRDPARFPRPDELDLHRTRTPHLAFGHGVHGVHGCLRQQLARIETRVAFTELLTRLPSLRLAVPAADIPPRNDMLIFGVHALPVTWA